MPFTGIVYRILISPKVTASNYDNAIRLHGYTPGASLARSFENGLHYELLLRLLFSKISVLV